jgi:hypothetical protein
MVKLLVNSGANPNKTDNVTGYSPLEYARRDRRSGNILRVLEAGPEKRPAPSGATR